MKSISSTASRRVVFLGALYDLMVTFPFATPWTFTINWRMLSAFNQRFGAPPLPHFSVMPLLIANLMGTLIVVWSVLRLRHPTRLLGRYDGTARFLFAFWMMGALLTPGQPILWLFLVPEMIFGVAQWWPAEEAVQV